MGVSAISIQRSSSVSVLSIALVLVEKFFCSVVEILGRLL